MFRKLQLGLLGLVMGCAAQEPQKTAAVAQTTLDSVETPIRSTLDNSYYPGTRFLARVSANRDESLPEANLIEMRATKLWKNLESTNTDAYLIDFSGSMAEYLPGTKIRKIDIVKQFEYAENAKLYGYSTMINTSAGKFYADTIPITKLKAQGDTPTYQTLFNVARVGHRTITLITDGRNDSNSMPFDVMMDELRRRGTRVEVIILGHLAPTYKLQMDSVAKLGGFAPKYVVQ